MRVSDMLEKLNDLSAQFDHDIAKTQTPGDVEDVRVKYMGRKGLIAECFKLIQAVSADQRKDVGRELNRLKHEFQTVIESKIAGVRDVKKKCDHFDYTLPGFPFYAGHLHPLTLVSQKIKTIFQNMGFAICEGPEVETEYYNFEALNIPKGHPARDMQDTLFLNENVVLRTHTSPVQIHTMENQKPPVRVIAPGRCYRRDTPDATHSPFFHQVEGLCVDTDITFADLKGVILSFAKSLFGSNVKIRFRPSYFPFTEPSAEYDFSCLICNGKGCRVCKQSGWIEISGAGMVNPSVFEYVGYDSEEVTGYAFGMGVERIAMLLYGIHDIRMFFENDMRFLRQF